MTNTVTKVIYELYDSDYSYIQEKFDSNTHEIDREICLVLNNGEQIYISWADTPIQYSIGFKENSWFKNKPDKALDASSWKLWKPIVGESFELIFHDKNRQLLELRCKKTSLYFAPLEINEQNWSTDVLHISSRKPQITS